MVIVADLRSKPTRNCIMYIDHTRVIYQLKRLVIWLWLYIDTILWAKQKLVLFVLFLGNLIYYDTYGNEYHICTETNTNTNTNTNKYEYEEGNYD